MTVDFFMKGEIVKSIMVSKPLCVTLLNETSNSSTSCEEN